METKFKIEFNKFLSVYHFKTVCNGNETAKLQPFENPSFYLDFHQDEAQFELKVKNHVLEELKFNKKIVSYETCASDYKKVVQKVPIVHDELSADSNYTTLEVHASFKDILLNLFSSQHKKKFELRIVFEMDHKKFVTIFYATIPIIDQKDWYPKETATPLYMPEDVIGSELIKLFQNRFKLRINSTQAEKELQRELLDFTSASTVQKFKSFNFLKMFQVMVAIEDLLNIKMMDEYSLTFQKVLHYQSVRQSLRNTIEHYLKFLMCHSKMKTFLDNIYVIEVCKKMPSNSQEFDHLYLTDMQDYQQFHDDLHELEDSRITCKIHYIFDNLILIKRVFKSRREAQSKRKNIDSDRPYHVKFLPNRISTRVAHRGIEDAMKNNLNKYLKDFAVPLASLKTKKFTEFEWMNESLVENHEQQAVVKNIINRTSFPLPYVIFGPPGTGKSTAIIEAIAQIVKLKPKAHILVTAASNTACDDIGKRLLKFVSVNKVLRLYSPSFDLKPEKIDKILEPISNFRNRSTCNCGKRSCPELQPLDDPTYEEFYTCRVVICTIVSCGRLVSSGVKSNHFDYVFIDEAASDCEPNTLIPISGLASSLAGVSAQIVLSGDHKQLGAIVRHKFCQKLGMEKSMMERIMDTNKKYQPEYNKQFVTQLVKNYRSHQAILQFSNENFYDSKLIPMCPPEIANWARNCILLSRNGNFPVLFHSTRTPQTEVGMSLMNEGEVVLLDNYIRVLLDFGVNGSNVEESDIGIISPYRAQRDRMIEQFQPEFPQLEIGTVDGFQGREKKIIIISTVRSQTRHVGFLRNEKRLNVALTRAKSLLIIIGNSSTLQKCVIWNKFIAFCFQNKAVVGDSLSVDKKTMKIKDYEGAEEIPEDVEDEYV